MDIVPHTQEKLLLLVIYKTILFFSLWEELSVIKLCRSTITIRLTNAANCMSIFSLSLFDFLHYPTIPAT